MKLRFLGLMSLSLVFFIKLQGQTIKPDIVLEDDPLTHNMGICSDGKYYYTINGGNQKDGLVNKYDTFGAFIGSYPFQLDMRSVYCNGKNGTVVAYCHDASFYQLELEKGTMKKLDFKGLTGIQSSPGINFQKSLMYVLADGGLKVFDFETGKKVNTGKVKCGANPKKGSTAIAVYENYLFTVNSRWNKIFIYDNSLKLLKTVKYEKGGFGFSLSVTPKYLFIADDGNYGTGYWYGYSLKKVLNAK